MSAQPSPALPMWAKCGCAAFVVDVGWLFSGGGLFSGEDFSGRGLFLGEDWFSG